MKLIYTGKNGGRVQFPKGVDVSSRDGFVRPGEAIDAHSERVGLDLIRQGVCRLPEEEKPEPRAEPAKRYVPRKKEDRPE